MSDRQVPAADPQLSEDERAAVRAYLQRSEVRLSTMHRVATALLSGAGLMVLLPAVERDAVVTVARALLTGDVDAPHALLAVAVALTLTVPFVALWLVLRDLTQFYFHANHVQRDGGEAFTPRFTLTGLRLPSGELEVGAAAELDRERIAPWSTELLVPGNDAARARTDERIAAYGGLGVEATGDDVSRAAALFELAGSRSRSLLEEVAKVEHGMARHVLRTQMIVLRYVKALLALLTTALAIFSAAAVVEGAPSVGAGEDAWIAGILLVWAPLVVVAVASPVRWLERQLRNEGATHTAVRDDRELTRVEHVTVRLAVGAFVAAAGAMVLSVRLPEVSGAVRAFGIGALATTTVALVVVLRSWAGPGGLRRVLAG